MGRLGLVHIEAIAHSLTRVLRGEIRRLIITVPPRGLKSFCASVVIKWDWFGFYDEPPVWQAGDKIIVNWDTAMSGKELSSYSARVVLQVRGQSAFVLDVIRQQLEYPNLKRKVLETHRRCTA